MHSHHSLNMFFIWIDNCEHFRHVRFTATHTQERQLLVGERTVLLILRDPKLEKRNAQLKPSERVPPYEIKSKFAISDISEIRLSPFADDFICIVVPKELQDVPIITTHKTELLAQLVEKYKEVSHGREFPITFTDTVSYRVKSGNGTRNWFFSRDGSVQRPAVSTDCVCVCVCVF